MLIARPNALGLTDDDTDEAPPPLTPVEAMDRLRTLVGHHFDGVDAVAYVRALRDDDADEGAA